MILDYLAYAILIVFGAGFFIGTIGMIAEIYRENDLAFWILIGTFGSLTAIGWAVGHLSS